MVCNIDFLILKEKIYKIESEEISVPLRAISAAAAVPYIAYNLQYTTSLSTGYVARFRSSSYLHIFNKH